MAERVRKAGHCSLVMAEVAAGVGVEEAVGAAAGVVVAAVTKPVPYSSNPRFP